MPAPTYTILALNSLAVGAPVKFAAVSPLLVGLNTTPSITIGGALNALCVNEGETLNPCKINVGRLGV